jgi:hypothetical protein
MSKNISLVFFLAILLLLTGCSKQGGRVSVILDNSGSMSNTGTSFTEVKETVADALMLVPGSYEKGLRVFGDSGSHLVSEYSHSLSSLQSQLKYIQPGGGTYIGQSLLDATNDLLEDPGGDNRLILITDGEGSSSDVQAAEEVKSRLANLQGDFECSFILFSRRENVLTETPIGRVSEILGCGLTVPNDYVSAPTLSTALYRIVGFDFYWLWIIISALLYFILLILTARLVFYTRYAQGELPYYARLFAITFLFSSLPLVAGAHVIGLFSWLSAYVWWLAIIAFIVPFIASTSWGKIKKEKAYDDPFV